MPRRQAIGFGPRRPAGARLLAAAAISAGAAAGSCAADAPPGWAEIGALFERRCVMCHAREAAALGLSLDSYEGMLAGSENGPVVVPGDPDASELVRRLRGETRPRMPFLSYPLAPGEIARVERWIAVDLPRAVPVEGGGARAGAE